MIADGSTFPMIADSLKTFFTIKLFPFHQMEWTELSQARLIDLSGLEPESLRLLCCGCELSVDQQIN
jgi:hypothetical protein